DIIMKSMRRTCCEGSRDTQSGLVAIQYRSNSKSLAWQKLLTMAQTTMLPGSVVMIWLESKPSSKMYANMLAHATHNMKLKRTWRTITQTAFSILAPERSRSLTWL